ncbi:MAG TPA: AraC family transcriptional regulator [Jatrophihabitans sp.]|nr:AraC family transcriptional regulator [Jatrophihabitans sp.]
MPASILTLSTRDPEPAHDALKQAVSAGHDVRINGRPENFDFLLAMNQAGEIRTARVRHTMRTEGSTEPFNSFMTGCTLHGGVVCETRDQRSVMGTGDVWRYPMEVSAWWGWDDVDVAVIQLPASVLERVAQQRTGLPASELRFDSVTPVSPSLGRSWRATMRQLYRQMDVPNPVLDYPLVLAAAVEYLANLALAVFPNTTMHLGEFSDPAAAPLSALRRAVAFIDTNASSPITLTDIAEAADVTPSALESGFRRHFDTSPTAYLRRVRIEGAHRQLQAADPTTGVTVGSVSTQWGFPRADRFAALYRDQYGAAPADTLRT